MPSNNVCYERREMIVSGGSDRIDGACCETTNVFVTGPICCSVRIRFYRAVTSYNMKKIIGIIVGVLVALGAMILFFWLVRKGICCNDDDDDEEEVEVHRHEEKTTTVHYSGDQVHLPSVTQAPSSYPYYPSKADPPQYSAAVPGGYTPQYATPVQGEYPQRPVYPGKY